MSADQDWWLLLTDLRDYIAQEIRRAMPFARDGKIDLSSNNIVGTLPPASGGSGTNTGAEPALGNPTSDGQVLSSTTAGVRSWIDPAGGALTNPMTTAGDLIIGGSGGAPTRLGIGSNGTVLGVSAGALAYIAGGGGGNTTASGTLASRPAAATAGNLYLPTDGLYEYRDTGSAWAAWGPLYPLTPPDPAAFAWVNQGSATLDTAHGAMYLECPPQAGDNLRMQVRSVTAGAISVTVCLHLMAGGIAGDRGGLVLYDTVSGKAQVFSFPNNANRLNVENFNSVSSFNGTVYDSGGNAVPMPPRFLRIIEDATNRTFQMSQDGYHFLTVKSVATGNFLTPNRAGIYASTNTGGGSTIGVGVTLLSWA